MFAPVGTELGQTGRREDEGRGREGRKVAVEGCDGLRLDICMLVSYSSPQPGNEPDNSERGPLRTFINDVQLAPVAWGCCACCASDILFDGCCIVSVCRTGIPVCLESGRGMDGCGVTQGQRSWQMILARGSNEEQGILS